MKRISKLFGILFIVMTVIFTGSMMVNADDQVIDEFAGEPIVVYGANLSDSQKDEVRNILNVNPEAEHEVSVSGQDNASYIGGNPNANMFSSAKIIHEKAGHGIVIDIITPENITQVTSDMYLNALITAGVENAKVEVASPLQVTGHSALAGIYKAYDAVGEELDSERMKVANDELEITTELSDREGLSDEKIASIMAEIKKIIAEEKPATREDVERIVEEKLAEMGVNLSDEDKQLLIDLFDRLKDLDIDFDQLKDQLNDIASSITDKLDDMNIEIDEGFFNKILEIINNIISSIASLFGSKG